jgi:hypothetical protein
MQELILTRLVAPLAESIKNGVVNPADMLRIKGFLPRLDEDVHHELNDMLDYFDDAVEQEDEDYAMKYMQKMVGFLEGHALTLED